MAQVHNRVKYQIKDRNTTKESPTTYEQYVTFWGTRGTIPIPNDKMLKYGGNTSCVEVLSITDTDSKAIIIDAGTGLIKCAENALLRGDRIFHLFLSHMHYDHMIGLTKFIPFFRNDCVINIYGQAKFGLSLKEIFQKFFSAPFFPVEFYQLPALNKIFFHELNNLKSIEVDNISIEIQALNHPQEALAYKVWDFHKKNCVVYASDHEHGSIKDYELEKFVKNADLLIYDTTYSDSNYKNFVGWGHSTAKAGASIAKNSNVKYYAIYHHDPSSSDEYLENKILTEAQSIFKNSFLSAEYQTLNISQLQTLLTDK